MDAKEIAKRVQIASALEVSGYPKPGNVHRTRNFDDMAFEDFIRSGVVIGNTVEEAALQAKSIDDLKDAELGRFISEAVSETDKWIANNTNLGIVMMSVPIAAAAAISDSFEEIRANVEALMDATTVEDACNLYDAIGLAAAGGMGDQDEYDVTNESAKDELRANNQTMYDVLKISAPWDRLASELTSGMPVVFEIGCPAFRKFKEEYGNDVDCINKATVLLFLTLLSKVPDTLISRKYGDEVAEEVSKKAEAVLKAKNSEDFDKILADFDDELYQSKYNPGTTADLTEASIFLSYLYEGFGKD